MEHLLLAPVLVVMGVPLLIVLTVTVTVTGPAVAVTGMPLGGSAA